MGTGKGDVRAAGNEQAANMNRELPRRALVSDRTLGFPGLSAALMVEYFDKIRIAVEGLSEEQLWWRPDHGGNAVGNLILHLCGNLSLWVLRTLGGASFERDRPTEFAADRSHAKRELVERLREVIDRCRQVAERLTPDDLRAPREVQGLRTDGLGALYHAVEHMSYHTGQIVLIAKHLAGGIEFYPLLRRE
jgi:uncharacterized damage-inducible protein DinB